MTSPTASPGGASRFEDAPTAERSEVAEVLDVGTAHRLAGLLDVGPEVLADGELPPLWHWVHLLERPASAQIGPDGHPLTGVPAPPGEGMKRMFAGGRVSLHAPLWLGRTATRRTWVTGSRTKEGRSGALRFVGVRTEISQDGRLAVVEENDIVYRQAGTRIPVEAGTLDAAPPDLGERATVRLRADEATLFRFSALTYNAHRIHYDLGWCAVEGYDGLVIHGPLQALLMGEHVRRHGGGLLGRRFDYRLVSPAVGTQVITAVADHGQTGGQLALVDVHGRTTATASHSPVPPLPPDGA